MCGYSPEYSRNAIIREGLKKNNIEIIPCTDNSKNIIIRHIKVFFKFLFSLHKNFDFVFVGFVGQVIVLLIKPFTILKRKPIIFDAFMSLYDTIVLDKKLVKKNSIMSKIIFLLDKYSCKLSNIILLDTNQHINYFTNTFSINKNKFRRIFVGSVESLFHKKEKTGKNKDFIIGFYGYFIPLQGTEYIIKAANILRKNKDIRFEMIGSGQKFKESINLAKKLELKNISFLGEKPSNQLPDYIANWDIMLGIFGNTEKTSRVIPNKAYDALAMEKPLITANTPAINELLTHKKDVFLCNSADETSLANAILLLKNNRQLRNKIAKKGYNTFSQKCSTEIIGKELIKIIK